MPTTVTITRSESAHLVPGTTYSSVAEADQALRCASLYAPHGGCYDKTSVTLHLGPHSLGIRIDLQHPDSADFEGIFAEAIAALAHMEEVYIELGDTKSRRDVFILRGFIVAKQMFGEASEDAPCQ